MDEDARWELALRQKQEADRIEEKRMEKELIKNGIARLKDLMDKQKKKGKKSSKKSHKSISKSSKSNSKSRSKKEKSDKKHKKSSKNKSLEGS